MTNKNLNIALASNEPFFPGLWGTTISLLASMPSAGNLTLHVFDFGLSDQSWNTLEKAVLSHPHPPKLNRLTLKSFSSVFENLKAPNGTSKAFYTRLFFAELFEFDRLIYLDSDLLVFKNLNQLSDVDIANSAGAAVLNEDGPTLDFDIEIEECERLQLNPKSNYFNSGVMWMNLEYWRANKLTQKCVDYLNSDEPIRFHDQTTINVVMNDQIKLLDSSWNRIVKRCDPDELVTPDSVLHYTEEKPWFTRQRTPASELFKKFCIDTGLEWRDPPEVLTIWDRFEYLNLPRSLAYRGLATWHRARKNDDRAFAYQAAADYWQEWFANREQRGNSYAMANRSISENSYGPDWLVH